MNFYNSDNYIAKEWDKLFDIQVRDTTGDVLIDYANYIILVYQSFITKTGEGTYYESAHYRGRMLQLFIMIRKLFGDYIYFDGLMSTDQIILAARPFIDNHIQVFCDKTWQNETKISIDESILLFDQMLPFCYKVNELLGTTNSNNTVNIEVETYHILTPKPLSAKIDKTLYTYLLNTVIQSYNTFVNTKVLYNKPHKDTIKSAA